LRRLGLEPSGLKKFTQSLHRLAVASGVSPTDLAAIIKEVSSLCEGREMSVSEARDYVHQLTEQKKLLLKAVGELEKKHKSLELDLSLKELDYSTTKETLSEFTRIKKDLQLRNLSITDLSKLVSLVKAAEQLGYSSSVVIDTLSELKSKQDKRREIDVEIESLFQLKRSLHEKMAAVEQEISDKQQTLKAAEDLRKMGFDFKDLDALHSAIRMISQTRNIEISAAKNQLLSDLEHYYADDHELRKRTRIMESLLKEKEEKFSMLEADYQNERAILDKAKELISGGLDENWLKKLRVLIDAYGVDLGTLSEELKHYHSLKDTIDDLQASKKTLEEEERLLRQKVVTYEDQRLRTLSLINQLIVKSSRPSQTSLGSMQQRKDKEWLTGLTELVRAANGEEVDVERFRTSALEAIEIICIKLDKNSPARLVLEHAGLALRRDATLG